MPEPVTPVTTTPPDTTVPGDKGGTTGAEPGKQTEAPKVETTDLTKLDENALAQVFDNPNLYNHPRFKELNELAKKAKEYQKAEEKKQEEELTKKGEFDKVLSEKETKIQSLQTKFETAQADNRIQSEASKLGVVDLEAILKLVDRANIKVNDDGSVTGVEEAVKALLESKPYLKGTATPTTVGTPTAPGQDTTQGLKKFKLSQLKDPVFYRENEKDIMIAYKNGLIEDDTH